MKKTDLATFAMALSLCLSPVGCGTVSEKLEKINPDRTADISREAEALPVTLADFYRRSRNHLEKMAILREKITEADARRKAAWGLWLPSARLIASQSVLSSSGSLAKPWIIARIRQPIFTGLSEYGTIRIRSRESELAGWQSEFEQGRLLLEIAYAYYGHILAEQKLEIQKKSLELSRERLTDMESRRRLGKSSVSELLSARSQVSKLSAELEKARNDSDSARETLLFLAGLEDKENLNAIRLPETGESATPAEISLDQALAAASSRGDIRAAVISSEISALEVNMARGEFLPAVYLQADYYIQRGGSGVSSSVTSSGADQWNIQAVAEIPVFDGFQTWHKIDERKSRRRQAELAEQSLRREAVKEIRQAWLGRRAAVQEIASFEEALKAAEENYRTLERDYRLRRVTNLEVVNALLDLQTLRHEVADSRMKYRISSIWLDVAMGKKPEEVLNRP